MSAVRKDAPETIPIRSFTPDPDEPKFIDEEAIYMFAPLMYGPHRHTEAELRDMWSRIWKGFHKHELCKGFIRYNRKYSLDVWREAFAYVFERKEAMNNIAYVERVASGIQVNGTREERIAKKIEAESAVQQPRKVVAPPTRQFLLEKGRPRTIDSIADDDPRVLRMNDLYRF